MFPRISCQVLSNVVKYCQMLPNTARGANDSQKGYIIASWENCETEHFLMFLPLLMSNKNSSIGNDVYYLNLCTFSIVTPDFYLTWISMLVAMGIGILEKLVAMQSLWLWWRKTFPENLYVEFGYSFFLVFEGKGRRCLHSRTVACCFRNG